MKTVAGVSSGRYGYKVGFNRESYINTLIEQTVRFLSKSNSPFIHEKSLTPMEIEDLRDQFCFI